jgi:hypothetical protein
MGGEFDLKLDPPFLSKHTNPKMHQNAGSNGPMDPFGSKVGGSNGSLSLLPRCSVLAAPTAADIGISFPPPLVFPKP